MLSRSQIFSSENWTTPLYDAMAAEVQFNQAIITAVFLAGWFLFANCRYWHHTVFPAFDAIG